MSTGVCAWCALADAHTQFTAGVDGLCSSHSRDRAAGKAPPAPPDASRVAAMRAANEEAEARVRAEVEATPLISPPEPIAAFIAALADPAMRAAAGERALCAWLGGSILASLGSFGELTMTRAEYQEHGAVLVERKCP